MDIGASYTFRHKRKGVFRGVFLGEVARGEVLYWRVNIATGPGSGAERLANAMVRSPHGKRPPDWTEKLILRDLVEAVDS